MPSTRSRRKIKVGKFLTRLRERAGLTLEDVGPQLRKSASQLSQLERGVYLSGYAELVALLMLYGASDDERTEAEALWEEARQDSTRIEYSSAVPRKFRAFLRAEADAERVRTLQSEAVPGLLSTGPYSQAIRDAGHRFVNPDVDADRAVAARLARQKLLHAPDPLKLHALITEAVVYRLVGGPAVMIEQLNHIVTTVERQDNVTVQVISNDAGAYGTMSGAVTILSFDDDHDPDVAYLEYPGGGRWVEEREDVEKLVGMFGDITKQALTVAQSVTFMRDRISYLEGL